ncbi:MAG: HNH endonuclease [Thermaerobacter sp.]|nr:HNH endonuclease [Thermaerobacter sp.]
MGSEVPEYPLEKWARASVYGGAAHVALEVEHILPKSRGGTDRVGNVALAGHACNQAKGNQTSVKEFGYPAIELRPGSPCGMQ